MARLERCRLSLQRALKVFCEFRRFSLDMECRSFPEAVAVVREHVLSNPDILEDKTKWIEGWGWDHTSWPTQHWPTAVRNTRIFH
jgi:hypothetical protein